MQQPIRPTWAEVDLDILRANAAFVKKFTDVKVMAVVKGNAYGHGLLPSAKAFLEGGVDLLGTALYEEAKALRDHDIQAPIMVIGQLTDEGAALCVDDDIIAAVFRISQIAAMDERAKTQNKIAKVHVKIETGFHRNGVPLSQLKELLEESKQFENVEIQGLFTHFSNADCIPEEDKMKNSFMTEQYLLLYEATKVAHQLGFENFIVHCCNTAATMRCCRLHAGMVRVGIGLYGYSPSKDLNDLFELTPALTWKSKIGHLQTITEGESVGYSRGYIAEQETIVATIPIGYADGYKRTMKGACVLVREQKCPVIGHVCMDHTMIDVTEVEDVTVGDEVVLLGKQGKAQIPAETMAKWADTINYDILVSISDRVPRIYLNE